MDTDKRRITCCHFLILFILFGIFHAAKPNGTELRFDSILRQIEKTALYKGTEAASGLDTLYKIAAASPDNPALYIRTLYLEAFFNNVQGVTDSTLIPRINAAEKLSGEHIYPFEHALLYYTLALSYFNVGNYSDAFATALRALDEFKLLNNREFIFKTFIALGNICASIRSDNMAEEYYKLALACLKPSQTEYYSTCSNIYMIWSHSPARRQEAIDSLLNLIPLYKQRDETGLLAVVLLNIAACYQSNSQPEKAFPYLKQMLDFIRNIDNKRLLFSLCQNMGNYYASVNRLQNALHYYQASKQIATGDNNPAFLSHVMFQLSQLYARMDCRDSAYYCLNIYNDINSRMYNGAKAIEAYKSYISVFLESSENKLKIAEQEVLLKNKRFVITVISAFAVIASAIFSLVLVQQKKKRRDIENRDLEMRLRQKLQIQQLQEEKIESQVREISSFSLLLFNKNQILQQIADVAVHHSETGEKVTESLKKINHIVKNNLNTDSDWYNFVLHFEKVHPHFFDRLKLYSSNITKTNMRLCAYFRIGISTKEIAQIMNIAPDTVKVTRHRLKKKLGLKEEENLDDFLRTL